MSSEKKIEDEKYNLEKVKFAYNYLKSKQYSEYITIDLFNFSNETPQLSKKAQAKEILEIYKSKNDSSFNHTDGDNEDIQHEYSQKIAVYSFGITALLILNQGTDAFKKKSDANYDSVCKMLNGTFAGKCNLFVNCRLSKLQASFIEQCIVKYEKRTSIDQLGRHLYLNQEKLNPDLYMRISKEISVHFNMDKKANSRVKYSTEYLGELRLVLISPNIRKDISFYLEKTIPKSESTLKYLKREKEINEKLMASPELKGCVIPFVVKYNKKGNALKLLIDYLPSITAKEFLDIYGIALESQARQILKGPCEILNYIHSIGIIHRDLKLENIQVTINQNKQIEGKLTDFGTAREYNNNNSADQTMFTMETKPPETALGKAPASVQSDIYLIGCVLYKLLFGVSFLSITPSENDYKKSVTCLKERRLSLITLDFLQKCLQFNPKDRFPSVHAMLTHDFFLRPEKFTQQQIENFVLNPNGIAHIC